MVALAPPETKVDETEAPPPLEDPSDYRTAHLLRMMAGYLPGAFGLLELLPFARHNPELAVSADRKPVPVLAGRRLFPNVQGEPVVSFDLRTGPQPA